MKYTQQLDLIITSDASLIILIISEQELIRLF